MRRRAFAEVCHDFRLGLHYGYPVCCVLHYCWDGLWGWPSSVARWNQIADDQHHPDPFVPCGIWHHSRSPLSLSQRLRAIAVFQARHLAPTRRGRESRALATRGTWGWKMASADEKRWFREQAALAASCWDERFDRELDWE